MVSREEARRVRLEVFRSFETAFASAPIRLMSRTVAAMRARGYPDLPAAIGDLDWRTVPPDDPEDPALRRDWGDLLASAVRHAAGWLDALSTHPMGYNLDSIGYPALTRAWSRMWEAQVGISMENRAGEPPQVLVYHGGNQALQAALIGIAEARRNRCGTGEPATILVPIPTFSCPLDQMALQGLRVVLLPPSRPDMDPHPADLEQIPEGVEVDGVYTMPVTNPTGRTVHPERMAAFVGAVLDRWPHAGVILDSVYVRMHPRHRQLLSWYADDPRFAQRVIFIDSLSKTHGVTGLRSGAVLTRSRELVQGALRYAQNVVAGPSNLMQAVSLALLAPYATGDEEVAAWRANLQLRIGRHMQRRRRLLLERLFAEHGELLDGTQPVLPDPERFDWEGSLYAVVRLSDRCLETARRYGVSPTVAFYLETGAAGVPLAGFCGNANLDRHALVTGVGAELAAFRREAERYVRLSFGLVPPPRG